MLAIMSCGVSADKPVRLLDVAGGTGDIAFRLAAKMRASQLVPQITPEIVVTDINESMLKVGEERAARLGFSAGALCSYSRL